MCLWAFSIMMIAASTIAPMAMAMPPSDMMLALMPCQRMTMKRDQDGGRQREDGDQRAADVEQEEDADQRDDDGSPR